MWMQLSRAYPPSSRARLIMIIAIMDEMYGWVTESAFILGTTVTENLRKINPYRNSQFGKLLLRRWLTSSMPCARICFDLTDYAWRVARMFTAYIESALRKARHEILPCDEGYFGKIEGLDVSVGKRLRR